MGVAEENTSGGIDGVKYAAYSGMNWKTENSDVEGGVGEAKTSSAESRRGRDALNIGREVGRGVESWGTNRRCSGRECRVSTVKAGMAERNSAKCYGL